MSKSPWKNINGKKRAVTALRSAPTSTMTIISLLNGFRGQNEYTTSIPIDVSTSIIKYSERRSTITSSKKRKGATDKTLGDVLWGQKKTISSQSSEQNPIVPPPETTSKLKRNDYYTSKLIQNDKNNNFMQLQQGLMHPGYDYDDTNCKIVNKRILCGYNKNLGTIPDEADFTNLNGDCRLRNDRIECGYTAGSHNLNNDVPYNQFLNNIQRTRPNQGQGVSARPPSMNNRGNFETLGNVIAIYDLHHSIRSSYLRDGKVDNQRKYKERSSRIPYQTEFRATKSEKKTEKIKATAFMDLTMKKNYLNLRVNTEKVELLRFYIDSVINANEKFSQPVQCLQCKI